MKENYEFNNNSNNNNGASVYANRCYGITKNPRDNDYLLVFQYVKIGSLHNNLSKNFKEITWQDKIESLWRISSG